MFKINEHVVYKRDVCKIKGIKYNDFNNLDYYVLAPIDDDSLTIEVPMQNKGGHIRALISKKEVQTIINEIPNISIIEDHGRMIESEYKKLLSTGDHLDLVKIIKTTHLRNQEREAAGKKIGEKDSEYFKLTEKILYNEFSLVLGMKYEDTKKYVIDKVENISKK